MRPEHKFLFLIQMMIVTSLAHSQQAADALLLYRNGQYQDAVEVCLRELSERGLDNLRQRMDSYSVLGWSYIRLGDYQNALKYSRQARRELDNDIRIIEIEAEALFYLGDNLAALELFELYVSSSRTGDRIAVVYFFMGEIYIRLNEFRHADISFSTALHHNPNIASWWLRLGYTREQIDDKEGAKSAYSKALELRPSYEEARVGLERLNF